MLGLGGRVRCDTFLGDGEITFASMKIKYRLMVQMGKDSGCVIVPDCDERLRLRVICRGAFGKSV